MPTLTGPIGKPAIKDTPGDIILSSSMVESILSSDSFNRYLVIAPKSINEINKLKLKLSKQFEL